MKKKIIITGGLGYIGTELCKLYSGVSWHHNIYVIDNRFISERVNQLRNWNIEFIHGDILDKNLVELIDANEVGTVLLSLIEIIGNDKIENIDEKRLYFISNTLNQINADLIRNRILLKVLPLKV